jgi:hypothetical protein
MVKRLATAWTGEHKMRRWFKLNLAWPINLAAYYFGGKGILALLGIAVGWGPYTLAMLLLFVVCVVGSFKVEREWSWYR